jgi:mannose-6-phosphate isomerase-like protein (cupin superfamily)
MMKNKANTEHYIWGDACDGWKLVDEPDRSIIHERMPPGTQEKRHYHEKAKQFFFVLEGTMTMEIGGQKVQLKQHEGVSVEPGTPHQARNETAADTEFLVISQPTTRGDRIEVE